MALVQSLPEELNGNLPPLPCLEWLTQPVPPQALAQFPQLRQLLRLLLVLLCQHNPVLSQGCLPPVRDCLPEARL